MESPPLCALIIGINEYQYAATGRIQNLRGCLEDAEDMFQYLLAIQGVPQNSIIKLLNDKATRAGILQSIQDIRDSSVCRDHPIWIFWAGHGSRKWCDDVNRHVEMLVPYDSDPAGDEKEECILDYLLGNQITELAKEKGDNITVILDTCHAASSTRWTEEFRVRGFDWEDDHVVTTSRHGGEDIARGVLSRAMSSSPSSGWTTPDMSTHVLLAATSSSGHAREKGKRGLFTKALLELLRKRPERDGLTYSEAIDFLQPLDEGQKPHCEGINTGHYLFQTYGPPTDDRFRFHREGPDLIVNAGEVQGIGRDTIFDLYDHTQSLIVRGLKVKELYTRKTTLDTRDLNVLPVEGSARQQPSGVIINGSTAIIDSTRNTQDSWPRTLLRRLGSPGNRRPKYNTFELQCDQQRMLSVARGSWTGAATIFELFDTVSLKAGLQRLHAGDSVDFEDAGRIRDVLAAASHFFHHLRHSSGEVHPLREHIKVTSHLLVEDRHDRSAPDGPDLFTKDGVLTPEYTYKEGDQGEHRCYGFTIVNNYHRPLYFWIFIFEMNDLSIKELYHPAQAKGLGADHCALAGGTLAIGYGSGGVREQAFFVPPKDRVAVSHMKIFVSTIRENLSHIARKSCFSSERGFGDGNLRKPQGEFWDTLQFSVISRNPM